MTRQPMDYLAVRRHTGSCTTRMGVFPGGEGGYDHADLLKCCLLDCKQSFLFVLV